MNIQNAGEILIIISMIFLSITVLICLVRAILGPRFTDRVLGVSVINVKTIIIISMLAVFKGKSYLVDIALVYAAISFLSVIILSRIFLKDYLKSNTKTTHKDGIQNGND